MTTRALLFICALGIVVQILVVLEPSFAVLLLSAWIVLACIFQVAAVLQRA